MTDHNPGIDIDNMPICFICANMFNSPVPKSPIVCLTIPSDKNTFYKPEDLLHYICGYHVHTNPGQYMWRTIAKLGI